MIDEDLEGLSLSRVLDRLERGLAGHRAVMDWLNIEGYNELVEIMHFNGRRMPGHRPMLVTEETVELVRRISSPSRGIDKSGAADGTV